MNLQSTDFELFDLPARFAQNAAEIDARWKALQRQLHPDRFAADGAAAQRVALQWSARINQARQRLSDPLARAAYLCQLHGAPVDAETNTAMPADFLAQQMQWREDLDAASDPRALTVLHGQVDAARQRALSALDWLLDQQADHAQAAAQVRALMFLEKLTGQIERKRATLD